jgi:hypothetical protein
LTSRCFLRCVCYQQLIAELVDQQLCSQLLFDQELFLDICGATA